MPAHLADPDVNPSFTKGIFLGEIREDLVFPYPVMPPDERDSLNAILDALRECCVTRLEMPASPVTATLRPARPRGIDPHHALQGTYRWHDTGSFRRYCFFRRLCPQPLR